MTDQTLTTVDFHGATLFAVQMAAGVFVPIGPICDDLGVAAVMQRKRIKADPILNEGGIVVILPSPGGAQETFCLRLDLVNGWLFTIDESRVKPGARERVLLYKRECYRVLFDRFFGAMAGAAAPQKPALDLPWRERPLEDKRVELTTAAMLARVDSPERALWYIDHELRIPGPPRPYKQRQGGLDLGDAGDDLREIMSFAKSPDQTNGGGTH